MRLPDRLERRLPASLAARLAIALVLLGVAGAGAAYATLVLSTAGAPPLAGLPSGGARTPGAGTGTPTSTGPATPFPSFFPISSYAGADGPWIVEGGGASFVGYRAKEILGFDFVRSPNDAVGRTTEVSGLLVVDGSTLEAVDISANVFALRSDLDMRDGHIAEYLGLERQPTATFRLTGGIEIGEPEIGRTVEVTAPGELSIRDVTKAVAFPLQARWDGRAIDVAGQLVIRRSDFGMDVPQLLGFRVAEEITIEVQLHLVRPCAATCLAAGSPAPTTRPTLAGIAQPSPVPTPDVATITSLPPGWSTVAFLGFTNRGGDLAPDNGFYTLRGGTGSPSLLFDEPSYLLGQLAWSADGGHVAYSRQSMFGPPDVWMAKPDGSDPAIVSGTAETSQPEWSPDGRSIVVVPVGDTESSLRIVDLATGQVRRIVERQGVVESPSWSPDGRRILFTLLATGSNDQDLYVVNVDGSGLTRLTTDPGYEYSSRWSSDGSRIAFVREGDLWLMDADGTNERRLTTGLRADSPAWSPDGARLAFVIASDNGFDTDAARRELWFVEVGDGTLRRIVLGFEIVAGPVWQP